VRAARVTAGPISSAECARIASFTTGMNIAAWSVASCRTPRHTPGRRAVEGMSVAITMIGWRDAHASPTAASVFAAPGPVVVSATPSRPLARAYPSAA
jgi:hypothetical protein